MSLPLLRVVVIAILKTQRDRRSRYERTSSDAHYDLERILRSQDTLALFYAMCGMPELFLELANIELVARLSADLKLTYQFSLIILFTLLLNIRSLTGPWLVNLLL